MMRQARFATTTSSPSSQRVTLLRLKSPLSVLSLTTRTLPHIIPRLLQAQTTKLIQWTSSPSVLLLLLTIRHRHRNSSPTLMQCVRKEARLTVQLLTVPSSISSLMHMTVQIMLQAPSTIGCGEAAQVLLTTTLSATLLTT